MSDTPETFTPRPYQAEAIKALISGWNGDHNRLAVVLPTGAGKTVVFANLISELLVQLGGLRALVIAHREELIEQAAAKIRAVRPDLRVGVVKAERDEHQDVDVIVASIQTLAVERRRQAIRDIGVAIRRLSSFLRRASTMAKPTPQMLPPMMFMPSRPGMTKSM